MTDSVKAAIDELNSDSIDRQLAAARHLAQSTQPIDEAASALIRAVQRHPPESVLQWIQAALEKIESPPLAQRDAICQVIESRAGEDDSDGLFWSATLLGRLGPNAAPAVGPLSGLLADSRFPSCQARAAWALGRIGAAAVAARSQLKIAAQQTDNPKLASAAERAIDEIGE